MTKTEHLLPLRLASRIRRAYISDEFFGAIIRGKQRIGKTSYTTQSMGDALGEWEWNKGKSYVKPNMDAVKEWTVFKPKELLDVVMKTYDKQYGLIWDDAGYWCFALDWYDPFVKSVSKYMQVAGTQFAFLGLTTPSVRLVSSKVLASLPDHYLITVIKNTRKQESLIHRPRLAKVYETWEYPDGKKGGVWRRFHDKFNAMLPNDFYTWYKPKRDSYLTIAKDIMKKEVTRLNKQMDKREESDFMEKVHENVGSPERLKELNEVISNLQTVPS